ncbi:DNA polymerase-3 subunit beta [Streptomyces sp. Amel2xB2]|uniref:DNA polymerase III subunit beta n=1 Tax=Streptomyces sp. Amel2xB2 TaxID=1305829 RepID=UPI000DBA0800|nr:hypothetical protein [Streptomyces sp. Amel2xB2]RAJ70228.1 DNA polymerase-3 subunit beta [Streptomyces sp. Amel2xB2]
MRVTAPQKELAAVAQLVARQLPNNATMPALMGMRLAAEHGRLTVAGFDGATSIRAALEADVDDDGSASVSARLLADVLGTLGKNDVTVEADGREVSVTTAGSSAALPLLDGESWPTLPTAPAGTGTVDGAELAAAYKRVKAAVNPKAAGRFEGMAGVRLMVEGDRLRVTATDSYRISDVWLPFMDLTPEAKGMAVAPDKVLASNLGAFEAGPVRLALPADGNGTVGLVSSAAQVVTGLFAPGTFPHRVDEVTPTDFTGTALFDAGDMVDALRRVSVVCEEGSPIWVRFDREAGSARLRAASLRGTTEATVDCRYDGDQPEFSAAWNGRYLTDGLTPLDGEVRMQVTTAQKPAVIADPEDDAYRYVVIPIRDPKGPQ